MQPEPAVKDTAGLPAAHLWEVSGPGCFSVPCAEDTPAEGPRDHPPPAGPISKRFWEPRKKTHKTLDLA